MIFRSLTFTKKYILALSLIAIFSTSAYFNLNNLIQSQVHDGEIINISGRQRMLSQKIALFAIYYKNKKLEETIKLMEDSHNDLLSRDISNELKNIYYSKPTMLDFKVKEYIKHAKKFSNTRDGRSLSYVLQNSQILLKELDSAVSIYQNENEVKIDNLSKNELYIFILILLTLVFEAFFIFKPANNEVKRKTKELMQEKEYSDIITQINTNAIIAIDNNYNVLTFNKSAQEMFGFEAFEMLHQNSLKKIIPEKYQQQHDVGLSSFLKSGKLKNKSMVFELEGKHKDGTLFPIKISFGTKTQNNHKIVVANIQNITKDKEKDNLIIHQSRIAAMGEMIGNIAHQWRQPLSSISTLSTGAKLRLMNNLITEDEIKDTFHKINNQTQHLSKTIDDFRDFFNKSNKKETFNINDIIDKSITLIEASYKSNNINIFIKRKNIKALIKGNSSELSQVLLNILNNAKDILLEKNIDKKVVLIKIKIKENQVILNINDNAGGIPQDIKMKIFDPYFTTKHQSQGTGIGLFMSKQIIEKHFNGTLIANNKEFKIDANKYYGASFSIKIDLFLENDIQYKHIMCVITKHFRLRLKLNIKSNNSI